MDESIKLIEKVYKEFNSEDISLSFNGGKDCTVLASIINQVKQKFSINAPIKSLYIRCPDSFTEVDQFVDDSKDLFNLDIYTSNKSMKDGLNDFMSKNKNIKVIFIGTRSTDPNGHNLDPSSYTDNDWPRILRVHPILHCSYHQVWQYLLSHNIPYCSLYDQGYTSLGSVHNTHRNPHLERLDDNSDDNDIKYSPAHTLTDDKLERSGRFSL